MAIGERIHFFRNKRGMTQKYVGTQVGFDDRSADVRMAQYESETRIPKDNLIQALANLFDVRPDALKVPNIDTYVGLMHTFFAIEDKFGLKIEKDECDNPRLYLDTVHVRGNMTLYNMLRDWMDEAAALEAGEITQEEYDNWRYHYPVPGKTKHSHFVSIPPQDLFD